MKIIRLQAENVKRIKVVSITPAGALVRIGGMNNQGKTSVLDSILLALGGKGVQPPQVVREGQKWAQIFLDLKDLVVERQWTEDGSSTLVVRNAEGVVQKSPQAVLDSLVSKLAFDPFEFARLKGGRQAEILRELLGLNFKEMDEAREKAFATRTAVNRNVKQLEVMLGAQPAIVAPDAPVSVADLLAEQQRRLKVRAANDARRNELTAASVRLGFAETRIVQLRRELAAAEAELTAAQDAEWATSEAVEVLVDPELESLVAKIADAETINTKVAAKKRRAEEVAKLKAAQDEADLLTKQIDRIDDKKAAALRGAAYPVAGLGMNSESVTFNALPLQQASSSEQLRVSLAMGLALNPTLKVVLIREGSLLDERSLAMVAQMAEAADAQVWVETVGEGGGGVIMEDGMARGPEADVVAPSEVPA